MDVPGRKSVVVAGWASIILFVYFCAVVADYVIGVVSDQQLISSLSKYRKSQQAEFQREISEDARYISQAKAEGYKPMLFPTLYDREGWTDLAKTHGIAPLAAQPDTDLYFCNEGYGLIKYHSDRFGFRNEDALWDQESVDGVLVGDSFGQGACVGFEQSIGGRLSQHGARVINLSSIGNNPIHYASILRVFVHKIKFKHLIILIYANDNIENEEYTVFNKFFIEKDGLYFQNSSDVLSKLTLSENVTKLYAASDREIDSYIARQAHVDPTIEIDRKIKAIKEANKYPNLFLNNIRQGLFSIYRGATGTQLPYSSRLAIDIALATCKTGGCHPLFFYIPNSDYWRPDSRARSYASGLRHYVESRGARFVDLTLDLALLGESAYARTGPHLSPDGYGAVANRLRAEMN